MKFIIKSLLLAFILSSCSIQNEIKYPEPVVEGIFFDGVNFTFSGKNLDRVKEVKIQGSSARFQIQVQTSNELKATLMDTVSLMVGETYNFLVGSANATSTPTQVVVELPQMGAGHGQIMRYNASLGKWAATDFDGLTYLGSWDASSNLPVLLNGSSYPADDTPSPGDFYVVSNAGSTSVDGTNTWMSGDWIIFGANGWERVQNAGGVTSFNGRTGVVVPQANDYELNDLADVEIPSAPTDGQVLKYQSGKWIPGTDNSGGGGGGGGGITSLGGQIGSSQTFAVGSSGTAPAWSSAGDTHTLNIPMASGAGVTGGLINRGEYDYFSNKAESGHTHAAATTGADGFMSAADKTALNTVLGWDNHASFGYLTAATEADPQVGTLTNLKWCTSDGTSVNCITNAPVTSESDPQVNTLTADKWCKANSSAQIDCTSDAPASGAFTAGSGVAYYTGGNVGVGISLPNYLLHVKSATGSDAQIAIDTTDADNATSDAELKFRENGTTKWTLKNDGDQFDRFKIYGATGNSILAIEQDGNIGIGTSTPSAPLQVFREDATNTGILNVLTLTRATSDVANGANNIGSQIVMQSENDAGTMASSASIMSQMTTTTAGAENGNLIFQISQSGSIVTGLKIQSDGFVGINESSALAQVHVTKDQNATTEIRIDNTNNGTSIDHTALTFYDGSVLESFMRNNNNTHHLSLGQSNAAGSLAIHAGGAEAVRIDSSGNVGIGTTSPSAKLHLSSDIETAIQIDAFSDTSNFNPLMVTKRARGTAASPTTVANNDTLFEIWTTGYNGASYNVAAQILVEVDGVVTGGGAGDMPGRITFRTTADGTSSIVERMRITNSGNVGIGTTNPGYNLHVVGTAGLSTGTTWTNASDIRLKDIQDDYQYGLDEVLQLHTVRYNYKKDNALGLPSDFTKTGFIAQEVQKVIPEAVNTREDGYLELNVDPIHWAVVNAIKDLYNKYIAPLVESAQRHDREIASVKAENAQLKQENAAIKSYLCSKDPNAAICK